MSGRVSPVLLWAIAIIVIGALVWAFVPGSTSPPKSPAEPGAPAEPATAGDGSEPTRTALDEAPPAPRPVLTGVVLGPEGQPEQGVLVRLSRVLSPWPDLQTEGLERALTRPDGRFSFRTPRGPDLIVSAEKAGLARTEIDASPLDPDLTLRMQYGFAIEGTVQDPSGRPMSDCTVILEPVAFSAHRAIKTQTDRYGRCEFRDVPAGGARLTARSPEFQPATLPSVGVGTQQACLLRFGRKRALRLRGIVTAAGDESRGIADATVRALPGSWNSGLFLPVVARTSGDGRFELNGLGPGNLRIEVHHPQYSTKSRVVVVSGRRPDLQLELVPRSLVQGRLVGESVAPGTRLELRQQGETPLRTTVTDDGAFTFDGKVSVGSAELTLPDAEFCFEESGGRTLKLQIEEAVETNFELRMVPASVVRGVVQDDSGAPVAGVRVLHVQPTAGPLAPRPVEAVTDERGRYEVRGLPRVGIGPGGFGWTRFVFRREGYAVAKLEFSGAGSGEVVDLEAVTLTRPGAIHGRVTRGGSGIAGAVVIAGYGMSGSQRGVSGPDGSFTLRGLPAGEYRVRASYATMPLVASDDIVAVEAGQSVGPVEVELPSGRTIQGEVVAPNGEPIADALIVVRARRGTAFYGGADGTFSLEVPEEDVELQVFATGELTVHKTVRVPVRQREVLIELPTVPWGTVVGKVLGLPGRKPVPGGVLRVRPIGGASGDPVQDLQRHIRASWVEMSGGELRLPRFPAGRSQLVIQGDGYAPHVQIVDVPQTGEVDLGTVLLRQGAHVRGVVVDPDGAPIAGARAYLGEEIDMSHMPREEGAFTDATGHFDLRGVSRHSAKLVVGAEGFATLTRELSIPDDLLREDPIPIALNRGSTIVVRVEHDSEEGSDLDVVILKRDHQILDYVRTDEEGSVSFKHRAPGTYEIGLLGDADLAHTVEVQADDQTYEIVVKPTRAPNGR